MKRWICNGRAPAIDLPATDVPGHDLPAAWFTAVRRASLAVLATAVAGCATVALQEAPIVDRSSRSEATPAANAPATAAGGPTAPGTAGAREKDGDGNYVVQRGDTLYSIALAFGRDYRDLARWNGLDDPTKLRVGQVLKVQPPGDEASAAVATVPVGPASAVEIHPLGSAGSALPPPAGSAPTAPAPATPAAGGTPEADAAHGTGAPAAAAVETAGWVWPAAGKVVAKFDDPRNKGIDIDGHEGDPVVAANDGTVVYSGSSLRGYGNLVIIKHSDDFISAYAHNREIVVAQGQAVKRGQRIAALGKSEADSPRLHFEIRRQGKPVDPVRYLPAR
ncbi:MAG TPA: peptidoglycan DD-metalloendopeptidase family protein [Burkholderiaceae bacterium]|nr:peptidoglycan DD-metalloendopeptidase family protein [Burkholderiaceae bacterium]